MAEELLMILRDHMRQEAGYEGESKSYNSRFANPKVIYS
jgi:hypothetical protein